MNNKPYTEQQSLLTAFGGKTGIQMVEETLAEYANPDGSIKAVTPSWLAQIWNQVEPVFGYSSQGTGKLSIGLGGTGLDCNNQAIIGAAGASGANYQNTQLDSALRKFEIAYGVAVDSGQAAETAHYDSSSPGLPAPTSAY